MTARPLVESTPFSFRHLGPREADVATMLGALGVASLDALIEQTVPTSIRLRRPLDIAPALTEEQMLAQMRTLAGQNTVLRSLLGMGYHDCVTPPPILRNILENPGWYTQYTPYQAEIAQGRLEALLNFQTMVMELTGLAIANASLLDEGTAAAEAMAMAVAVAPDEAEHGAFFVDARVHPQTREVVATRARALGIEVVTGLIEKQVFDPKVKHFVGALVQYPTTTGEVLDYAPDFARAKAAGVVGIVACDPLALTILRPPGEFGAEIALGSSQRFGVPMGYGGPHAAFLAASERFTRKMPGRIVGVSRDSAGNPGMRLTLQTREQHIRREKATSNICTAQVLLAVMASMYAVYHGPDGLVRIANRVRLLAESLRDALRAAGWSAGPGVMFDTLTIEAGARAPSIVARARALGFNLRLASEGRIAIALDERSTVCEIARLASVFGATVDHDRIALVSAVAAYPAPHGRTSAFLTHPVFNSHRSETELVRYMNQLQARDLSLVHAMIPLGSCTMKLNATTEMIPVTWPEFGGIHPFAPVEQAAGYHAMFDDLERDLAEITGFHAVSLQPNAGSQGEYTGLLVIRRYQEARGQAHRNVCLIPSSAHGTNPASAVMVGLKVVVVACDAAGNIDLADLAAKADLHKDALSCLMATYPSTHGVFEEGIVKACRIIHERGGQVYMDGANLNAQVGLCRPGDIGADVCHLNLHKTFCIPHGGGGPGMGPIGVARHLAPHLPRWPVHDGAGGERVGAVSAAPWGSASILPISYTYIRMMGPDGLRRATELAILSANYIAHKLGPHYPVLYRGSNGRVAHECILDLRGLKKTSGIEVEDVAKRLIDYGFHAPTVSFPVPGTMMIEPTESEPLCELDRFIEAMVMIRAEIAEIERGEADRENNVLTNAPHTAASIALDDWPHPYSRARAAFPTPWTKAHKFWPFVGRIDNVYGDRHLQCSCTPVTAYA